LFFSSSLLKHHLADCDIFKLAALKQSPAAEVYFNYLIGVTVSTIKK